MRIGVLGATGHVGKGVLKVLDREEHQVTAYYRTSKKAYKLKEVYSERIGFVRLDLHKTKALAQACEECDILINCAGPASELMDQIACSCMQKGKLYIDVAGGSTLKRKVESAYASYKSGSCILGAGIYPGLTEVFAAAVAKRHPSLEELRLYFYGNSQLSEIAAYDIIAGMADSTGGMSYLRDGKVVKITGNGTNGFKKQPPFDRLATMPVLGDEFCEMARSRKVPAAYFYHSFASDKALMDFVMIKALEKYKTVEQKKESAKKIQELFYRSDTDREVVLLAGYVCGGEKARSGWFRFWSDEDLSLITGYVAGLAAAGLAKENTAIQGVFYLAEVVDAENMLERLSAFCKVIISQGMQ